MTTRRGPIVREPETGERRQAWGTVTPNAVRLDSEAAETVVDALHVDHAGSFNLFYLLRKHFWVASGAEQDEVAAFLEGAYTRVRELNDDLAVRIVDLGGIPPNTPPTIQERAAVHLEAEDVYDLRTSLEGDLEGYGTLIAGMRGHVAVAAAQGDTATATQLRGHLEELEADTEEIRRFLADDTLVRGTAVTDR
jgi:DNA-binding ferritin-like protein